ncbi:MAG: zf-HC2 domain-containing protein [Dehalococcoidia bacterium]|nr:MAG: zf-HC2 domain-containing protein [Dehalococcoidia bacterium]
MLEALMQFRHRRFRRDLSAYVDDMLSERARRRLEAHLDSCEACRQELAELRVTVEALGSLPMAEAPRSFTLAAAPVAEVRPRPAARRLEFGLRLATATAAFALALVLIGDFAGLPGGGDEEEEWVRGELYSATRATPAAMEAAPVGTPEPAGIADMPPVVATPTPAAVRVVPTETPAAEETPPAPEAAPVEEPAISADVSEEEPSEKAALEGAGVEDEGQADGAEAQAVDEEDEGGGLSREEAVRWLEIGLGAGVGALVILWAVARFRRSIGNRP